LKPPLVTILDRDADAIRARMRRQSPALLSGDLAVPGWLPPRFVTADLETVDFAHLDRRDAPTEQAAVPVTAWALCTGDDDLNLRASLALQTAMQTRRLDGAPIHVRIWDGSLGQTHTLGQDSITLASAFGGLEEALDQTTALEKDPDKGSKRIHLAYLRAEAQATLKTENTPVRQITQEEADQDWANLHPSKKASNKRAYLHGGMKLADLGFDWRCANPVQLPSVNFADKNRFDQAQQALAPIKFLDDQISKIDGTVAEQSAVSLKSMQNEHDRWVIDRAIDGWSFAVERDESRLEHCCMAVWDQLSVEYRNYDGVLLRALLHLPSEEGMPEARVASSVRVHIPDETKVSASVPPEAWQDATEIVIMLPTGNLLRPERTRIDSTKHPYTTLIAAVGQAAAGKALCRVQLVFPAPPTAPVLKLASLLAAAVRPGGVAVQAVWAWREGADHAARLSEDFAKLPDVTGWGTSPPS